MIVKKDKVWTVMANYVRSDFRRRGLNGVHANVSVAEHTFYVVCTFCVLVFAIKIRIFLFTRRTNRSSVKLLGFCSIDNVHKKPITRQSYN